jgi:hypothetical protein
MNDQQIKRIIEDSYDQSREDGLRSMAGDFYSRKLRSSVIAAWAGGLVFLALLTSSAVQFFKARDTQQEILYATLFIVGIQGIVMMKIFSWQMIHRCSIKRDIKKLELRVAELAESRKA